MSFERIAVNTYRDNARGVTVRVLGRVGIQYETQRRSLRVDSEVLAVPAIAVAARSIRRWDDGEDVRAEDRDQIIRDIVEAVRTCVPGADVEVIAP